MDSGGEATAGTIFQLLADEYSRRILLAADREPRTAKDLSRLCDASLTTVYRRVSTLQEHNLVDERSTVDADGSHHRVFETTLEELHLELSDGDIDLSVATRDELADNFTSLWSDLRDST
ncbi:ArsR/SmtB family transcription factor [Halorientalis marina]|uniref:ArsR/SmtB family transcription factor n=1 Tax=Halorientalis marina TaxID=2931976 RepID=UPI001FF66FA0|nr:helix-turn-helix domain-containing protein [Halorientalis marina]